MNVEEVRKQIARMKRDCHPGTCRTNFYTLVRADFEVAAGRDSIAFWYRNEDGVCRVFFHSYDLHSLLHQLDAAPPGSVIDCIGTCDEELLRAFHAAGFRQYARFLRLSNKNLASIFDESANPYGGCLERFAEGGGVEFAAPDDLDPLCAKIEQVFDRHSAHFMSKPAILELIRDRKALVHKRDGRMLSFLIFTITGKKFYVAYVYNSAGSHVALGMYARAAKIALEAGCTYGYSWVEETNEASLRFNRLKQYVPDGMTDTIFMKKEGM